MINLTLSLQCNDVSCQVFSRASDQESCGWWRAVIKMIKGDFHVVEYLGWETTYTEIVPSERLRVKSTEPSLSPRTFVKFDISFCGLFEPMLTDIGMCHSFNAHALSELLQPSQYVDSLLAAYQTDIRANKL